ncbi:APC family permease [Tardiphaga sp.]|uniref:APC family permease n=1 Tax=Tardiphaga sp. TaxID=1926292 RepID=UPI0025D9C8FF|nr:APC family permease [Tardiphaga sp.]
MTVQPVDAKDNTPHLMRSLTLTHAVLYGLGVTIGAGIYVLVGVAAGRSGMHAPLAFLGAALVMSFTAATFAELGTRMPVSASEAAYVESAFHRGWFSLAVGLLVVATATVSAATISAGSAGYIAVFVPVPAVWIITGVVLAMGAVACVATVHSVSFAGLMTVVEVGGLVLIIIAGMTRGSEVISRLPEMWPTMRDTMAWTGIASTSLIAVFAFIGFEHLVNVAEEMQQPNRTLPRALFFTLGLTALIYGLIVWIAVIAVPPAELSRSPAPLALVFERLTGLPLVTMSAIAIIATLNGVIVHIIMIGRVLYGLADQGNLPKFLTRLNPVTHTPIVATMIGVGAILILSLAVPLVGLADLTSRLTLVIFAIVNVALIRIKLRGDQVPPGAFTCPLWTPFGGLITSIALLVADRMPW